ncbi:MAG: hypothetical protein AMJ59_22485 [Gammaproteobacteria bacterium SG8_31]|nr:MAG: hypothetical protein AMJ59_22485 [Gammaproteobacteria bacterium SG8_31]
MARLDLLDEHEKTLGRRDFCLIDGLNPCVSLGRRFGIERHELRAIRLSGGHFLQLPGKRLDLLQVRCFPTLQPEQVCQQLIANPAGRACSGVKGGVENVREDGAALHDLIQPRVPIRLRSCRGVD